jgi:hypothetical protein
MNWLEKECEKLIDTLIKTVKKDKYYRLVRNIGIIRQCRKRGDP